MDTNAALGRQRSRAPIEIKHVAGRVAFQARIAAMVTTVGIT